MLQNARFQARFGILSLGCVLAVVTCLGCARNRPQFGAPGTVQQQQFDASLYDPYADVDVGPEVVGSRPRDFQKPLSQPDRSRWLWNYWSGR